jgi:protein-S-isoprenylcysteine O-methyltransferase Ste14
MRERAEFVQGTPEQAGSLLDIHARPDKQSLRPALVLAWLEKLFVLLLYGLLVRRVSLSLFLQPVNALLILGETFDVFFILLQRRAKSVRTGIYPSLIAFAGTSVALLAQPGGHPLLPPLAGGVLMLAGGFLALSAKLSLRRSFGLVPANRGVVLEGPYRFVRHPMYAGYIVLHLGFLVINPVAWNLAIYSMEAVLLVARILEEEKVLVRDPDYFAMTARVRWRLVPGIF